MLSMIRSELTGGLSTQEDSQPGVDLWRQQIAWVEETPEGWNGSVAGSMAVVTRITVREAERLPACLRLKLL